jgi:hypothetical protein
MALSQLDRPDHPDADAAVKPHRNVTRGGVAFAAMARDGERMERVMYRLAIVAATFLAFTAPLSAQSVEYKTVADALAGLKAKKGVKFSTRDGWTFADETDGAQWSFTPPNHYANPSVGRRELHRKGDGFFVVTRILCEAPKPACDRLHKDYELLNQRMNEAIQRNVQKKK